MAETSTVDTIHTSYDPLVKSMVIEDHENKLLTINEVYNDESIMMKR